MGIVEHKGTPFARHLRRRPDPELIVGAVVEGTDVLGGLVAIVSVHPEVYALLAHRLVLDGVLDDAPVGVQWRLPLNSHRVEGDGLHTNVSRR